MSAEEKVEQLHFALRGIELDEREERIIGWAGHIWDQDTVETVCSLLEKVREAGYLSAPATTEGLLMHKDPNKDWGWSATSGGSAYMGGNDNRSGNAESP